MNAEATLRAKRSRLVRGLSSVIEIRMIPGLNDRLDTHPKCYGCNHEGGNVEYPPCVDCRGFKNYEPAKVEAEKCQP